MAGSAPAAYVQVLQFWFGGAVAESIRSKWFTHNGSAKQAAMDEVISKRFGPLVERGASGGLDAWAQTPHGALALIVVLDQFSRHVYRRAKEDASSKRATCDQKAVVLARKVSESGWLSLYSVSQRCFALMPLRHAGGDENLAQVRAKLEEMARDQIADADILERFRKATLRSLQSTTRHGDPSDILERPDLESSKDVSGAYMEGLACSVWGFLVERYSNNESPRRQCVCVSLSGGVDSMVIAFLLCQIRDHVDALLKARGAEDDAAGADGKTLNVASRPRRGWGRDGKRHAKRRDIAGIARTDVPDTASELPRCLSKGFDVCAAHIDYGNRSESSAEAAFVGRWCDRHSIRAYMRTATEYRRGITRRDAYETLTRAVRYGWYRHVTRVSGALGVVFGHHIGDVQENVISNSMKGGSVLNLSGMSSVSTADGVEVWRPLLAHSKDEIYSAAHRYGVPYFKDTTPRWSNRGRMRNEVLPLLGEVFGDGFRRNMSALAKESDAFRALFMKRIFEPFLKSVHQSPAAVWIECAPFVNHSVSFWREGLRIICEKMLGLGRVHERSVAAFLETLQRAVARSHSTSPSSPGGRKRPKKRCFFVPLRRNVDALLRETKLILFRPSFFAGVKSKDPDIDVGTSVICGPWEVSLSLLDGSPSQGQTSTLAKTKPNKVTLEDVLEAEFSYTLFAVSRAGKVLNTFRFDRSAKIKQLQGIAQEAAARKILRAIPPVVAVPVSKEASAGAQPVRVRAQFKFCGDDGAATRYSRRHKLPTVDLYNVLVAAHAAKGDAKGAEGVLARMITAKPIPVNPNSRTLCLIMKAYLNKGDIGNAHRTMKRGLELNPPIKPSAEILTMISNAGDIAAQLLAEAKDAAGQVIASDIRE